MPKRDLYKANRRFTAAQIEGYRCQLAGSINACTNGAEVELDLTSAQQINEILRQVVIERRDAERIQRGLSRKESADDPSA